VCRPKHVEQLRNIGIINSTARLHLIGSFYEFYDGVSLERNFLREEKNSEPKDGK